MRNIALLIIISISLFGCSNNINDINECKRSLSDLKSSYAKQSTLKDKYITILKQEIKLNKQFIIRASKVISMKKYCDTLGKIAIYCDKEKYNQGITLEHKYGMKTSSSAETAWLYALTLITVTAPFLLMALLVLILSKIKYKQKKSHLKGIENALKIRSNELNEQKEKITGEKELLAQKNQKFNANLKKAQELELKINSLKEDVLKLQARKNDLEQVSRLGDF